MKIIDEAPGHEIPFKRKGRRYVMTITVPKDDWKKPKNVIKSKPMSTQFTKTETKNRFNPISDDMNVDNLRRGLFIGQAVKS